MSARSPSASDQLAMTRDPQRLERLLDVGRRLVETLDLEVVLPRVLGAGRWLTARFPSRAQGTEAAARCHQFQPRPPRQLVPILRRGVESEESTDSSDARKSQKAWLSDWPREHRLQLAAVVVAAAGVLAGIGVALAVHSGSLQGTATDAGGMPTRAETSASQESTPKTTSPAVPPAPRLDANARCSSFERTSDSTKPTMMFVTSPGKLAGGDTIKGRVLPHGRFADLIRAIPNTAASATRTSASRSFSSNLAAGA